MDSSINPNEIKWDSGPPPKQQSSAINPNEISWDGSAVSPAPPGFSDAQQHQIKNYIPKAKDGPDLERFARSISEGKIGVGNADEVVKYYRDYKKVPENFSINPSEPSVSPEKEPTAGDYVAGAAENLGRGFVKGLGFIDDAINPLQMLPGIGNDLKGIYHGLTGQSTAEDEKAFKARHDGGFFEKNAGDVYDSVAGVRAPKNVLQRYLNAGAQGVGGALVPMGEFNGVRGIAGLTAAGGVGGAASQAAQDVAPNHPLVADLAGLVGAHVAGTPFALKPLKENVYLNRNGGMTPSSVEPTGTLPHPEAASVAEAAQALADKAKDVAPDGLTPKGRGQLTVTQINRVGLKPLIGIRRGISRLVSTGQLDKQEAASLSDAIANRDGITKDEIDGLRGSVAGDATADALQHYRSVQNLTKPYGGDGRGLGSKAWNMAVKLTPIPKLIADAITIKPGDVNASRIRGADKAIDNVGLYERLGDKTGASGLQDSLDTFHNHVRQTYADEEAAQQAAEAQQRSDDFIKSFRQAQADAAKKAQAAKKAAKSGMSDKEDASYTARENAVQAEWTNPDFALAPRPKNVQSALDKVTGATQTMADWESALDNGTKLNGQPLPEPKAPKAPAAPKPKAESALDKTVRANIEAGVQGNYNSYADTLGVKREDVHRALEQIKTDDIDPFEVQKLIHGYKLSPAGRAGLIPRLQKALTEDGTVAARAKEAEAATAAPPAAKAAPKAAAKPSQVSAPAPIEKALETPSEPPVPDDGLNYKNIKRPANHNAGRARFQANFDKAVNDHAMTHDGPILSDAASGIQYMRDTAKTTDAAMEYFDTVLGPKLRHKGYETEEIDHLREALNEASTVGKPYRNQAELEKGAMTKGPGRPKKPKPSDDVPF